VHDNKTGQFEENNKRILHHPYTRKKPRHAHMIIANGNIKAVCGINSPNRAMETNNTDASSFTKPIAVVRRSSPFNKNNLLLQI
jgi:hypothetical protein